MKCGKKKIPIINVIPLNRSQLELTFLLSLQGMVLLYVENITPRLRYIIDFFSNQLFDDHIRIIQIFRNLKYQIYPS